MEQARSRLYDYLSLEDERPFIHKAFANALNDADRLAYAQLVEEREPERAEWLRLEVALHSRAADDPAVIARFIELSRKIGFDYANVLLRDVIMNCGSQGAVQERPWVRFAFACTKRWETLAPTDAESVRFCQQCKERVYYCDTVADAESRALAGQCIAIPKRLSNGGVESEALGRPDPVHDWAARLFSRGLVRGATPGSRSADGSCLLVVIYSREAELLGQCHPLEPSPEPITIGRGAHNSIVLVGEAVSRSHARFERRADGWWVIDDGSTNGVHVNQEQVQEARLRLGDHVWIGFTILKLVEAPPLPESRYPLPQFDGLTGLHNRGHLFEQIDRELKDTRNIGRPLALVLFDLDRFKQVNDTHGHLAGDQVLRETTQRMRQHVRPGDLLARHASDQFALLLPGTDPAGATALAEQIRTEFAAHPLTVGEHTISVTLSAGIAQANQDNYTAGRLIAAVERDLHAAKRERRRQPDGR